MGLLFLSPSIALYAVDAAESPAVLKFAHFRLYEGSRGENPQKPQVVSSYHLKLIPNEPVSSDVDIAKEQETLKRVFNLTGITLMTESTIAINRGTGDNAVYGSIVLNGRKLLIRMSVVPKPGNPCKVEVLEETEGSKSHRSLLETTLVLSENKTTSVGFEESGGKIYFLTFLPIKKGEKSKVKDFVLSANPPKLLKKVQPQYPEEALKAHISGRIVLTATTDTEGKVVDAKVESGPAELRAAALDAIKQWVYAPFILNGEARRLKFTVVVAFSLDKEKPAKKAGSAPESITVSEAPKILVKVNPTYPPEALKKGAVGTVVLEAAVDTDGNVIDVKVVSGEQLLTQAAVDAVKQWKYAPYIVNSVKKSVRFTVVVKFTLKDKKDKPVPGSEPQKKEKEEI